MGTTSSKPNPTARSSKSKRTTAAAKGYYDYNQHYLPGYWPSSTEATYGYPHPGVVPNYAPVIPPSLMPQYPPYYPAQIPAPITMPQPQPYILPQPVARPVIPVTVQPAVQPAVQPEPAGNQPVIPPVIPPAPPREPSKKRKPTRKKMPTTVITFELPNSAHARRPSQTDANRTSPDLSRSLSNAAPLQQGRSTPQSHAQQPSISSPTRSFHEKRASIHSPSQAHQPTNPVVPPPTDQRPRNPLPKLPVDIFTTTPYRHVLEPKDLPAWPPLEPGKISVVQQEVQEVPQPAKRGLFGLKKKNPPPPLSQTKLVYFPQPVSTTTNNPPATATSSEPPPTSAIFTNPPASVTTADTTHTGFQPPTGNSDPGHGGGGFEPPPSLPPIYFNQDTEYAPFLNHSPHSVSYERVTYPTATHLIEAMKFLPETEHNRGIAELIRKCVDLADVYRLSHEHREAQNEENGELYMDKMERVMYLKFNQHGYLADLLLSTGEVPLVYDDPSDSFWGIGEVNGEPGHNELGHMLGGIRARLRDQRMK